MLPGEEERVLCLFDNVDVSDERELSFREGDELLVLRRNEHPGWSKCRHVITNKEGLVPCNFVRDLQIEDGELAPRAGLSAIDLSPIASPNASSNSVAEELYVDLTQDAIVPTTVENTHGLYAVSSKVVPTVTVTAAPAGPVSPRAPSKSPQKRRADSMDPEPLPSLGNHRKRKASAPYYTTMRSPLLSGGGTAPGSPEYAVVDDTAIDGRDEAGGMHVRLHQSRQRAMSFSTAPQIFSPEQEALISVTIQCKSVLLLINCYCRPNHTQQSARHISTSRYLFRPQL